MGAAGESEVRFDSDNQGTYPQTVEENGLHVACPGAAVGSRCRSRWFLASIRERRVFNGGLELSAHPNRTRRVRTI